jgi:tetratricopeptide (TPR) repeat protein
VSVWKPTLPVRRTLLALFCWCWLTFCGSGDLSAQDRVTFRPRDDAAPITMSGEILEYTGRKLTIRPRDGAPHAIDAGNVVEVKTYYDPAHLEGLSLLNRGKVEEAREKFTEALKRDKRDWVSREILSWLVRCAYREGDMLGAIAYFREIVKSDPLTRHWGVAPLVWAPQSIGERLRTEGRRLLTGDRASDRLLGASLLLLDPDHGEAAERQIRNLSSETNPRISGLARAQRWRLILASRDVSENILASWKGQIDYLPEQIRGGPQYLVARGYEIRGEDRRAAAEYLWIPLVYSDHDPLAARALLDAAEASRRSGLTHEAEVLYRELLSRYPWSTEATSVRTSKRGT